MSRRRSVSNCATRHIERLGINKVEAFLDQCLSLENLIDPWAPFSGRAVAKTEEPLMVDTWVNDAPPSLLR